MSPLRPRKPFLGIGIAAILGILIAEWWPVPLAWASGAAAAFALAALIFPRWWMCCVFSAVAFFSLHEVRHHHSAGGALEGREQLVCAGRMRGRGRDGGDQRQAGQDRFHAFLVVM
jgi:hypothetical protein